ncbi:PP2C family protein-serine/threonine phosphatase [Microbacterium paludicola]|uniref:Serine/threonine-protein phosphatase n=1 Tax=Microbacterium paludicola TaxID=300019 RepID=A0A4Y9FY20_9MICO|nr:serine/threonine-protein phosphatase [Microbacterium paludicola]TFU33534.1 serine/threonine-protein phosphatase [Microbacterium paludicola]
MSDAPTKTQSQTVALPTGLDAILTWAGVTHRGRKRDINQDALLTAYPLFVVADGMGGHIGGEIASASAIDRLQRMVGKGPVSPEAIEKALIKAVRDIGEHPETTDEGTGTTVTGVYLDITEEDATWVALNIGDSRVYIQRDDALAQVTTDHSLVQELVAAGRLSPEEAENHPYGNVITRAVGPSEGAVPDYVRLDVRDGDRFVICSDGLTKELTDYGILHFLRLHDDPQDAVEAMLEAALENGGRDNITIVVLNVAVPGQGPQDDAADAAPASRDAAPVTAEEPIVDDEEPAEDSSTGDAARE